MKERERKNPIIPTENEKEAVALANQFKEFVSRLKSVTPNTSPASLNKIIVPYNQLRLYAFAMVCQINGLANQQGLTEITSYYFLYFLQQVSRFNSLFQECTIADLRDNPKTIINSPWTGYPILKDKDIKGINHPLLGQPANLKMGVVIRSAKIFREAYEYNDEGTRFYYHEKTTPDNTPHQDRNHYSKVNFQIAAKTQASNLRSFFKTDTGQAHDNYFKHGSKDEHEREQRLFRSAIKNIHEAVALTPEQLEVLQNGKFYRYHSSIKFRPNRNWPLDPNQCNYQITHIGHAAELLAIDSRIPLHLVIDPIHYQSGTGGLIGLGGKLLYDRKTDPAFGTHDYPPINLVLISHNHYDHLCLRSLTEAFGQSNTLFIVPKGDAELLHKKFGMTNVIEMDWNDVVQITLKDDIGIHSSTYEIRGFPANHASNRSTSDLFMSLYMGYMVRETSKRNVILFTGDTAKLEDLHYENLATYLQNNNLTISTACIAHGPDRPRSLMECTHQSSADALTMHSKFNVINALQYANRIPRDLSWEDIAKSACYAIGYHQGCYRLGLLSIHDVDTTLLRTLSVLTSFGDLEIDKITKEQLNSNLFYNFMDNFEQEALQNTLTEYGKLTVNDKKLTAQQVFTLITSHLTIPQVGARNDFGDHTKFIGFEFDYSRLILNKNPSQNHFNKNIGFNAAYEYFAYHFNLELIENDYFNPLVLTEHILNLYLDRTRISVHKENKSKPIKEFLNMLPSIDNEQLPLALGTLYLSLFPKQDEGLRDEGHTCTAFLILAGLIYNQGNFRQQFKERCVEVQASLSRANSAGERELFNQLIR
jgi:L-ascorbate metabolism protein UlaG (beta-lactamase superfamily)